MSAKKNTAAPLKYVGGGMFAPGLPMRDLTAAEVDKLGGEAGLVATSLYAPFAVGEEPVTATVADLLDSDSAGDGDDAGSLKKSG